MKVPLLLSVFLYCSLTLSQVTLPFTSGLVGYYPFNNDINDHSGNSYDGVGNNISYDLDFFNSDKSGNFFAGDSYANVGDIDDFENTDEFSVSFWMKTDSSGNGTASEVIPIMTKYFDSSLPDSCSWGIFIIDDSLQFNVSDGTNTDSARFDIYLSPNSDYFMYTITFFYGEVNFFVNGGLEETKTFSVNSIHNSNTTYKIGDWRQQDSPSYLTFYGNLDEILIYNTMLSSNQVDITYGFYLSLIQGLNEDISSTINLFPNPTKEHLHLQSQNSISEVMVYSIEGKLVKHQVLNSDFGKIQVGDLDNGIYIVETMINSQSYVKHIVVNN
jgi:hypothetical protein